MYSLLQTFRSDIFRTSFTQKRTERSRAWFTTFTVNKSRLNWTGSAGFPAKCELYLDLLSLGLKHRVDHYGPSLVKVVF